MENISHLDENGEYKKDVACFMYLEECIMVITCPFINYSIGELILINGTMYSINKVVNYPISVSTTYHLFKESSKCTID